MSPEAANICLIDDMRVVIDGMKSIFDTSDHTVVLTAMTPEEGLKAVDEFKKLKVQVVILDTKLVFGDFKGVESGKILEKIREVAPDVKVISVSSGETLEGADVKLYKTFSREEIIDIVNNI